MSKYDRVLIVGDLNIHVCCPNKLLARDFLNLIDAFNLVQSVSAPTHEHGHTLDLVLSYGLPVCNVEIFDAVFSDHIPILFEFSLPCNIVKQCAPDRIHCMLKPSTATQFLTAFNNAAVSDKGSSCFNTEELISLFLSTCQNALDTSLHFSLFILSPNLNCA